MREWHIATASAGGEGMKSQAARRAASTPVPLPPSRRPSEQGTKLPGTAWSRRRARIFEGDGYRCRACGRKGIDSNEWDAAPDPSLAPLTLDHIIPRSKGGTSSLLNLQTLCRSCNTAKGNKMPELRYG